jgi:hypothetical protein
MRRLRLAVLILVVLATAPAAGSSTPIVAETTKPQAIAAVKALLKASQSACGYRLLRMSARRLGSHWRVTAVVTGEVRGTSHWLVVDRKARPASTLARTIRAGCPPAVQPAPPPPPPPPPEPPLTGPGAPATYVFGPELTADQQALVRRGLDAAARYYRVVLGRELAPFTVWAYRDLEALLGAYAQNEPTSAEAARRLWEGGQVGHATPRKVWLGPAWFIGGRSAASGFKIAAHEAFHLLQYELVGQRPLGVSGLDEIPPAGPWWLAEGAAEYFAYLAVVRDGALGLAEARAQWVQSARGTGATLRALATLRGQRETPGAYDIYALSTELLLRGRDPKIVFSYYEAIARGVPWPDAFSATFGRTFDAFVDEFEAYRRTL